MIEVEIMMDLEVVLGRNLDGLYCSSDQVMERPFRILEHRADVGFEAFGENLERTFANAARALVSLSVDIDSIQPVQTTRIRAQGHGLDDLLVNWLSEVLYLIDGEKWLFRDFEMKHVGENDLLAVAHGEKYDPARHAIKMQVKAITYHQLALEETRQGWRAQVYVDI